MHLLLAELVAATLVWSIHSPTEFKDPVFETEQGAKDIEMIFTKHLLTKYSENTMLNSLK